MNGAVVIVPPAGAAYVMWITEEADLHRSLPLGTIVVVVRGPQDLPELHDYDGPQSYRVVTSIYNEVCSQMVGPTYRPQDVESEDDLRISRRAYAGLVEDHGLLINEVRINGDDEVFVFKQDGSWLKVGTVAEVESLS